MARQVTITAVGAYVPAAGSDQPRPYFEGAIATLDDDVAARLVEQGTAKYADDAADEQVGKTLDDMKVDELRSYADEHEIDLGSATKKAEIRKAIDDALAARQETTPDLTELDDEALLALAVEREVEVPQDADREQILAALTGDGK